MISWRKSLKRRKHQQNINKVIRAMNKNLKEDDMWRGRFEVRQIHSDFYIFEDRSGAYMISFLEIVDKKERKARIVRINESQFFDCDVWRAVNTFITEDIQAPLEKSDIDYSNIDIPTHSLKWWRNYWYQIMEV